MLWWLAGETDRLSKSAAAALGAEDTTAIVSAVSVWEVAIKRELGKLDAPDDLLFQLEKARVSLLSITPRHADHVAALPPHHRDPFDRLLVAQAAVEALPLVSADVSLRRYDIDVIW